MSPATSRPTLWGQAEVRRLGGGGDRTRTDDPLVANQVLYQLSYAPMGVCCADHLDQARLEGPMVGLTGVEPVTSRLSGERSNQLSYRPIGVRGSQAGARRAPRGAVCLAAGPTLVPRRSVQAHTKMVLSPRPTHEV